MVRTMTTIRVEGIDFADIGFWERPWEERYEPDRLRSAFVNGIEHMPATWTPGGAR
jgi:hypothetical protein